MVEVEGLLEEEAAAGALVAVDSLPEAEDLHTEEEDSVAAVEATRHTRTGMATRRPLTTWKLRSRWNRLPRKKTQVSSTLGEPVYDNLHETNLGAKRTDSRDFLNFFLIFILSFSSLHTFLLLFQFHPLFGLKKETQKLLLELGGFISVFNYFIYYLESRCCI